MIDVSAFREWQQAGRRSVKIELEGDEVSIWVYDYDLMAGQFVKSVDEIDLVKVLRDRATAEYERVKELVGR